MSSLRVGLALGWSRLRTTQTLVVFCCGLLGCALGAIAERGNADGVSASLLGMTFGLVIPLSCLELARRAFDSTSLTASVQEPARWGSSRRELALGVALSLALVLGAWCACAAATTVFVAGGSGLDALRSAGVGAESGIVYACLLMAASSVGKHGRGRLWFMTLDWLLGAGVSGLAVPFPRSHLANLLGAVPPADWSQAASGVALICLCLLALSLVRLRVPS